MTTPLCKECVDGMVTIIDRCSGFLDFRDNACGGNLMVTAVVDALNGLGMKSAALWGFCIRQRARAFTTKTLSALMTRSVSYVHEASVPFST